MLLRHFDDAEAECNNILAQNSYHESSGKTIVMAAPAFDQCLLASHLFNLLDARGVISVSERQNYIGRVRTLAKLCATAFLGLNEKDSKKSRCDYYNCFDSRKKSTINY